MGDVTRNFSFSEFKVSRDFPELAAEIVLTESDKAKIKFLCVHWLQPLRDETGDAIEVLSGKRSVELNNKVGGVNNSDHLFRGHYSCAVDFYPHAMSKSWSADDIIEWIEGKSGFKQLIWYSKHLFFHFAPLTLSTKENQVIIK